MKKTITIASTLEEWNAMYADYQHAMLNYRNTSRIVRFFKGMEEPKHPAFRSLRLLESYTDVAVVELRCYDGLTLACREGDQAFKLDLATGDATPMLGSRGMKVSPKYRDIANQLAADIYDIAKSHNLREFPFYQDYENMINSCEDGYYL